MLYFIKQYSQRPFTFVVSFSPSLFVLIDQLFKCQWLSSQSLSSQSFTSFLSIVVAQSFATMHFCVKYCIMFSSLFAMKGRAAAVSASRICTEWHRLCTSPRPAWPGGPSGEATSMGLAAGGQSTCLCLSLRVSFSASLLLSEGLQIPSQFTGPLHPSVIHPSTFNTLLLRVGRVKLGGVGKIWDEVPGTVMHLRYSQDFK